MVAVEVKAEDLGKFAAALKAEQDGKQLRRELAKNMRGALAPAAEIAKGSIMSMASAGPGTSPALRSEIAKKIRPEVRLSGRSTGARVKARKIRARDFANAPKRTQSAKGWRRMAYGRDRWVVQYGKVEWFDRAMAGKRDKYRAAVIDAMQAMADRIAKRSGG